MKKLGIIGGMGPQATSLLFSRIVSLTDAACDQDHPPIIVLDDPSIPDRTAYLLGRTDEDFKNKLIENALLLESWGCEVLAMPCNTAHAKSSAITDALTSAILMNMPELAVRKIEGRSCSTCAILATDGTIATGIYDALLEDRGITPIHPSPLSQEKIMKAIYTYIKAGSVPPSQLMDDVFAELLAVGCDAAIIGCTELSTLNLASATQRIHVVDALDCLAAACVSACGAPLKMRY